jgi:ankyrin repeat protein
MDEDREHGFRQMNRLLLTTIAAVVLAGCGESQQSAPQAEPVEPVAEVPAQPSSPPPEAKPVEPVTQAAKQELPTAKAPDTSIHEAAEAGNIEAVKQHLAAGTDVNARDEDGWTPLDWSGVHEPEITKLLLIYGGKKADWFNAGNSIHAAAQAGHIEAVKKHLADGVDVNSEPEGGGWNALYCAAAYGHKEIVELLIAKGANINQKDEQGLRPLDRAVRNTDVVDLLRKNGAKSGAEDSIHIAAVMGNIGAIERHLNTGVNVNAKNNDEWTPLHFAANGGHKEIVEILITEGAEVNAKEEDGRTPLDWANINKQTEIADLLRKHGGKTGEELGAEGK